MEEKLTPKQQMFIREYLKDLNATQAAIRSGYSVDTARQIGCENLTKPYIQEAIQKQLSEKLSTLDISNEYVLMTLKDIVGRCMQEEPVTKFNYETKEFEETGEYTFNASGALKGLELLGKYLKLFTDKVEMNATVKQDKLNDILSELKHEDRE